MYILNEDSMYVKYTIENQKSLGLTKTKEQQNYALIYFYQFYVKFRTWSVWWREGFLRIFKVAFDRLFYVM